MSDAILLRGGGEKPIHMRKKYSIHEGTIYEWDVYNTVTEYKWNVWDTYDKYNPYKEYLLNDYSTSSTGGSGNLMYYIGTYNGVFGWRDYTIDQKTGTYTGVGQSKVLCMTDWGGGGIGTGESGYNTFRDETKPGTLHEIIHIRCLVKYTYAMREDGYTDGGYTGKHFQLLQDTSTTIYEPVGNPSEAITSLNQSQYPSDGVSGNKYYKYSTSYLVKGSIQQPSVRSSNVSAYPNNGISGSYWYGNRQSIIEYSMGNYIEDAFSLSQDTYPANGIAGSYWYVYQGKI